MSKVSLPIGCSVILSLVFIHGVVLPVEAQPAEGGTGEANNNENNESANRLDDLGRAPYAGNLIGEPSDRQPAPNYIYLGGNQQRAPFAKKSLEPNRDDYHANIDLARLNDAYRYEMLDGVGLGPYGRMELHSGVAGGAGNDENPLKVETLINKLINSRNNRFSAGRGQYYGGGGKRPSSVGYPANALRLDKKEDKDYTFVAEPAEGGNQLAKALARNRQQQMSQDFASRASLWASDVLRDLQRQAVGAQARLRGAHRLTPAEAHHEAQLELADKSKQQQLADNNDIVQPDYRNQPDAGRTLPREKRRRCKMDPNLGVKNPSFCDTDAYFGAADYSMRDVWDSAGRRR